MWAFAWVSQIWRCGSFGRIATPFDEEICRGRERALGKEERRKRPFLRGGGVAVLYLDVSNRFTFNRVIFLFEITTKRMNVTQRPEIRKKKKNNKMTGIIKT